MHETARNCWQYKRFALQKGVADEAAEPNILSARFDTPSLIVLPDILL